MPDADAVERDQGLPFVVVSDVLSDTDTAAVPMSCCPRSAGAKEPEPSPTPSAASRQRDFLDLPGGRRPCRLVLATCRGRTAHDFNSGFGCRRRRTHLCRARRPLRLRERRQPRDFDIGAAEVWIGELPRRIAVPMARHAGPATVSSGGWRFFADGRFYHADGRARFVALEQLRRRSCRTGAARSTPVMFATR